MKLRTLGLAAALALGMALPATAATVILDTLNTRIGVNPASAPAFALITLGTTRQNPLGQSFETTQEFRDLQVEARFLSFGATPDTAGFAVDFLLFGGAGVMGTPLGTVSFDIPGGEVAGRRITSRVASFQDLGLLAPGVYTAAVRGDGVTGRGALLSGSPRILSGASGVTGTELLPAVKTPGSTSHGPTGVFDFRTNLGQEFGFRVTGTPAPGVIPLPPAGLLLIGALGLLALARRRAG